MIDEFNSKKCFLKEDGKEEVKSKLEALSKEIDEQGNENDFIKYREQSKKILKTQTKFKSFFKKNNYFWAEIVRYLNFKKRDFKWTPDKIKKILEPKNDEYVVENAIKNLFICLDLTAERFKHYNSKPLKTNNTLKDGKIQYKKENTDPEKRIQKAADFLRSFDCVQQESISKPKIVRDKMGIFPTEVKEKELEPWFRWRLTKCMGDFEKIKKITINIDYSVRYDFNQFWHKFGDYIGERNNLNSDKVINGLVNLCKEQPVIVIINNVKNFYFNKEDSSSYGNMMFEFFQHLFKLFKSNENKSYKSYLVIFLTEGKKKSQDTNQEYLTQINHYSPKKDIIQLEFIDFFKEDIESWLVENEHKLEEDFGTNIKPEMMEYLLEQDSITLLYEVCQQVFKLKNGIFDVEHHWKNIA
ncbi:MAG: hypothetical protein AAF630_00085 [Cyanobacteria bacterium P01_C01_bin.38]